MSINGLNSNQILTLMQLESGKTYTFVGATDNYSDYMCVTAGMFETPVVGIENYVLDVSFRIGDSTTIRLNLPADYDSKASFFAPGTITNTSSQGLWYTDLMEGDRIFSLNGSDNAFFIKDDVSYAYLRIQSNETSEYYFEGGTASDYEHSHDCELGVNSYSMQPIEESREGLSSDESIVFNYSLYIKEEGGRSYTDCIRIVGDEEESLSYHYDIIFDDFYSAPKVFNGLNDPYVNYDNTEQIGNTLYRTVELVMEGEIGFIWGSRA